MRALFPFLLVLSACASAEQVAQDSVSFCTGVIGYDLTPGTAERIAGLDCAHEETMFRRGSQGQTLNTLIGIATPLVPTTSTVIHKVQ